MPDHCCGALPAVWYKNGEMASPQEQRIREVLDAYFSSINGEQWERLASLFHPDAQLRAPGTRTLEGGEEVASYYRAALRPYPVHRDEPTRVLICEATATVEIHFEGRLANDKPLSFEAVDVFDFEDGLIHRLSSWYDSHQVRRDLRQAAESS